MFYQNMMKEKQIINTTNNFLPTQKFLMIKGLLDSSDFPWYFNKAIVSDNEPLDHIQFTHTFFTNGSIHSNFFKNLSPLLNLINPSLLVRIKANLQPITSNIIKHQMHTDEVLDNAKITTGIFYINTNDGKTIFETGEEVKSEENKYIEFDSKKMHTGTTCTNEKNRIVINFNYIK
jgi:hypothetical protein